MLTLNDCGEYIGVDGITAQNIKLIKFARDRGFENDDNEFEIAVALYNVNAMDDDTAEWFDSVASEALEWLNEQLPSGLAFGWYESTLMLLPDFEWQESEIAGKWAIDDIRELYNVTLQQFLSFVEPYGYRLLKRSDEHFWLELI